jgi:CarD family transcriptional regulator
VFDVGDMVVYPHQGAGRVMSKETRVVLGEEREYLTILILHSELTVMVPADSTEAAGIRRVMGESGLDDLVEVLTAEPSEIEGNWNRRFRHNREKIKSGDVPEVAEVVRNLARRDDSKGLSSGERQLLSKAKRILASEVQFARGTDEDEALAWVNEVLAGSVGQSSRAE